jgi:hypothetical protein
MGARGALGSSRGHNLLGLAVPALCIAGLLLAPGRVYGEFRLFDLGADYLSELQKSLTISSSTGTVTVHDREDGSTVTGPLDGDPRLLNRKFDVEWSVSGPGVRLPLSLFKPRSIGGVEIHPILTLEALYGDFDLRFLNQRETAPDDALHGRGPMYGVELALRTESPQWFTETGYRFHSLPSIDADRSQPFFSQGARVLSDETRLSRETHDVFSHVGYKFSEALRSYTGVRYRRANVEIEDDLRFADTLLRETTLSSRTKLDGSATEAIIGVEVRRGSFMGRTEVNFNSKDYSVLATVVYAGSLSGEEPGMHQDGIKEDPGNAEMERRLSAIADAIAPKLASIEARFLSDWETLTKVDGSDGQPAYLAREVRLRLDQTEQALVDVLKEYSELEALVDWVKDEFRRIRVNLKIENQIGMLAQLRAGAVTAVGIFSGREPSLHPFLSSSKPRHAQARERTLDQRAANAERERIKEAIQKLGELQVILIFKPDFEEDKRQLQQLQLRLFPRGKRSEEGKSYAPNTRVVMTIGSYSWEIKRFKKQPSEINCDGNKGGPAAECPLDIIDRFCVKLKCGQYSCQPEDCL